MTAAFVQKQARVKTHTGRPVLILCRCLDWAQRDARLPARSGPDGCIQDSWAISEWPRHARSHWIDSSKRRALRPRSSVARHRHGTQDRRCDGHP
jgi:hypothetical protein